MDSEIKAVSEERTAAHDMLEKYQHSSWACIQFAGEEEPKDVLLALVLEWNHIKESYAKVCTVANARDKEINDLRAELSEVKKRAQYLEQVTQSLRKSLQRIAKLFGFPGA
jgi:predicted RNase H-like nuclease (RuvC/YqgF family)